MAKDQQALAMRDVGEDLWCEHLHFFHHPGTPGAPDTPWQQRPAHLLQMFLDVLRRRITDLDGDFEELDRRWLQMITPQRIISTPQRRRRSLTPNPFALENVHSALRSTDYRGRRLDHPAHDADPGQLRAAHNRAPLGSGLHP